MKRSKTSPTSWYNRILLCQSRYNCVNRLNSFCSYYKIVIFPRHSRTKYFVIGQPTNVSQPIKTHHRTDILQLPFSLPEIGVITVASRIPHANQIELKNAYPMLQRNTWDLKKILFFGNLNKLIFMCRPLTDK